MQKQIEREMTMEEIEAEFDGEWVLIANPETDQYNYVTRGTVLFHSPDRDEMDNYALAQRGGPIHSWASFYIGEIPEGVRVVI